MLRIDNLTKTYGSFKMNISMEVTPGSIVGIIGPNGAGKSTAFKSILQLIRPESGSINLFGTEIGASGEKMNTEMKNRIGVVFSDSGFSGYLNGKDVRNILKNMYKDFEEEKFDNYCRQLNIPMDKKLKEFSTGMKAKMRVIAALTHKADFLILDEPTAGLDVLARDEILDILREYMAEKDDRCILISSHISSDLENLCDELYMIKSGEIVLHEACDVLLSDYAILKVSEEEYGKLDKEHILRRRKENYGYMCMVRERRYYMENYPGIVIEKSSIDDLIQMMIKGENV